MHLKNLFSCGRLLKSFQISIIKTVQLILDVVNRKGWYGCIWKLVFILRSNNGNERQQETIERNPGLNYEESNADVIFINDNSVSLYPIEPSIPMQVNLNSLFITYDNNKSSSTSNSNIKSPPIR